MVDCYNSENLHWQKGCCPTPGPADAAAAYGGRINNIVDFLPLTGGQAQQLAFNATLPSLNTDYGENSIIVKQAGIYKIDYTLVGTSDIATVLTIAVRQNGNNIPTAMQSLLLQADVEDSFAGSTIAYLAQDTVLDMSVALFQSGELMLSQGANTSLVIVRLS